MRNPYQPTAEELTEWAYNPDSVEPVQDWDIIALEDCAYRALIMKFVIDRDCPNRSFFLHILYLTAGDLFRRKWGSSDERRDAPLELSKELRSADCFWLMILANRIEDLLVGRLEFEYRQWCAGKLAYEQPNGD